MGELVTRLERHDWAMLRRRWIVGNYLRLAIQASRQLSSSSPLTRLSSLTLSVTRARPSDSAWAAMSMSFGPMSCSFFSNAAKLVVPICLRTLVGTVAKLGNDAGTEAKIRGHQALYSASDLRKPSGWIVDAVVAVEQVVHGSKSATGSA